MNIQLKRQKFNIFFDKIYNLFYIFYKGNFIKKILMDDCKYRLI